MNYSLIEVIKVLKYSNKALRKQNPTTVDQGCIQQRAISRNRKIIIKLQHVLDNAAL